jgi:hypothetical protein
MGCGTGRTDFQNGDPRLQYDSIFGKLLKSAGKHPAGRRPARARH